MAANAAEHAMDGEGKRQYVQYGINTARQFDWLTLGPFKYDEKKSLNEQAFERVQEFEYNPILANGQNIKDFYANFDREDHIRVEDFRARFVNDHIETSYVKLLGVGAAGLASLALPMAYIFMRNAKPFKLPFFKHSMAVQSISYETHNVMDEWNNCVPSCLFAWTQKASKSGSPLQLFPSEFSFKKIPNDQFYRAIKERFDFMCKDLDLSRIYGNLDKGKYPRSAPRVTAETIDLLLDAIKYLYGGDGQPDGYTAIHVQIFARCFKAHMYAYGENGECVLEETHIQYKEKKKPICFYIVDDHMYWIYGNFTSIAAQFREAKYSSKTKTNQCSTMQNEVADDEHFQLTLVFPDEHFPDSNDQKRMDPPNIKRVSQKDFSVDWSLPAGTYLFVNKHDVEKEFMDVVKNLDFLPRFANTKNNKPTSFTFHASNCEFCENGWISYEDDQEKTRKTTCKKCLITFCSDPNVKSRQLENIDVRVLKVAQRHGFSQTSSIGALVVQIISRMLKRKSLSKAEKSEVFARCGGKCCECEEDLELKECQFDHIIPLGESGQNHKDNFQILCIDCHKEKTRLENERGYLRLKAYTSQYSVFMDKLLSENDELVNVWQFVQTLNTIDTNKLQCILQFDINRCRRNILYNMKYSWPVFSSLDEWEPFDGEICCGYYYVETQRELPMRGNGLYTEPTIVRALDRNWIQKEDIQFQYKASHHLPAEFFREIVDQIEEHFKDDSKLCKVAVNAFVGLLVSKDRIRQRSQYSKSLCKIAGQQFSMDCDEFYFERAFRMPNGEEVFRGVETYNVAQAGTTFPIYKTILELEALELHDMIELAESKGCIPMRTKTDALRIGVPKSVNRNKDHFFFGCGGHGQMVLGCVWEHTKTPKYKWERVEISENEIENRKHLCRTETINVDYACTWTDAFIDNNFDFSDEVEQIAGELFEGEMPGLLIHGGAGYGKTTLTNMLIESLQQLAGENSVIKLAPTHAAKQLIDGITVHSFHRQWQAVANSAKSKSAFYGMMRKARFIFLDEISMVQSHFYDFLSDLKKVFPCIRYIMVGHFAQFAPVKDPLLSNAPNVRRYKSKNYEHSQALHSLVGGYRVDLKIYRRGDKSMLADAAKLERAEEIDIAKYAVNFRSDDEIGYTNNTRIWRNDACINLHLPQLGNPEYVLVAPDENFDDVDDNNGIRRQTQYVKVFPGLKLVCVSTNQSLYKNKETFPQLENGDRCVVTNLYEEHFEFQRVLKHGQEEAYSRQGKEHLIEAAKAERIKIRYHDIGSTRDKIGFQRVFRPGYCVTAIQSQGDTLLGITTIYDWDHYYMRGAGRYVSFTRQTTAKNVQISAAGADKSMVQQIEATYDKPITQRGKRRKKIASELTNEK